MAGGVLLEDVFEPVCKPFRYNSKGEYEEISSEC